MYNVKPQCHMQQLWNKQYSHIMGEVHQPNSTIYRINWKKDILCINCGLGGHTSKNCNFPITSFGIVAFMESKGTIYYLMVQRKDTLCYTEFLRGKYELSNVKYIAKLFSHMTKQEKDNLLQYDFDTLWKMLWINNNHVRKEYQISKEKFEKIYEGYHLKTRQSELQYVDMSHFVNTTSTIDEQEWEFPKGRRKINESDVMCALREFEEETSINREFIQLTEGAKQYEEIFIGKNKIRYRNIFFIAKYTLNNLSDTFFDKDNGDQIKEIKDVKWMTYNQVCSKIKMNIEKLDIFRRMNTQIIKTKEHLS